MSISTLQPPARDPESLRLISIEEVARLADISQRTAQRWKSSRKLPKPVYIGRTLRWRFGDICHWIDQGCPAQNESRS